jgi:hypothetical protein
MSNAQRWLIYTRIGQVAGQLADEKQIDAMAAIDELFRSGFAEQIGDLETGYYLESDAYLYDAYKDFLKMRTHDGQPRH